MNLDVVLPNNTATPHSRGTDKTTKADETDRVQFNEALDDKQPRRRIGDKTSRETEVELRPNWQSRAYSKENSSIDELPGDGGAQAAADFQKALEQFLTPSDTGPEEPGQEAVEEDPGQLRVTDAYVDTASIEIVADRRAAAVSAVVPAIGANGAQKADAGDTQIEPEADEAPRQRNILPGNDILVASVKEAQARDPRRGVETIIPPTTGKLKDGQAVGSQERPAARSGTQPNSGLDRQPAMASSAQTSTEPDGRSPTATVKNPEVSLPADSEGNGKRGNTNPRPADVLTGKVNILSVNAALPPVSAPATALSTTAAGLVSAIEGDATWRNATSGIENSGPIRSQANLPGVNSLRIQLNPVELGMVTARLTASGEQLSVEIQVESNEARQKLTSDSEAILKALRSVGYDVERVTITQNSQNANNNPQQGAGARDQFMHDQQQSQRESKAGGQNSDHETSGRRAEGATHAAGNTTAATAGGSLYI